VAEQEVAVAEPPEHADAGQAGSSGREYIYIAIADINGIGRVGAELSECFNNGVGSWFAPYAVSFMLAHGYLYLGEEVAAKLLGSCHHLVADHGQATTAPLQFVKHLGYAVVGPGGVEGMSHVVLAEGGEGCVEQRVVSPAGDGALHKLPHAVTHETADVVGGVLRHTVSKQRVVHRSRKIA
jgi:hypothetical protein